MLAELFQTNHLESPVIMKLFKLEWGFQKDQIEQDRKANSIIFPLLKLVPKMFCVCWLLVDVCSSGRAVSLHGSARHWKQVPPKDRFLFTPK